MLENSYETLLTLEEVILRVKLSTASIYALMSRGEFPRSRRVGSRATRWRSADIDEYIRGLPVICSEAWSADGELNPAPKPPAFSKPIKTPSRESNHSPTAVRPAQVATPAPVIPAEAVEEGSGDGPQRRRGLPIKRAPSAPKARVPGAREERARVQLELARRRNEIRELSLNLHREAKRAEIEQEGRPITYRDWMEHVVDDSEVNPTWLTTLPDRLLHIREVSRILSIGIPRIVQMARQGCFPKPLSTDEKSFVLSEIEAWADTESTYKARAALDREFSLLEKEAANA